MGTEEVLKALGNVQEPDLKKDLVTLNMVRDIIISENSVEFTVVLTTPACPMKELIRRDCEKAIHNHMDEGLEVIVNFTANTSSIRVDLTSVLPGVKNIIAVVSGKGGVGKSTVAANLAIALSQQGAKVGLMDADIYGPSVPIMFGVRGQRPLMESVEGKDKIVPLEQHGIKLISIGLLVDEKSAVVWRGPMASSAIRQFVTDVHWGELDYLVIDMPPGTSDIQMGLARMLPRTDLLIVTTPAVSAQKVAIRAADMARRSFLRVAGVIENMSEFTCDHGESYALFGEGGGQSLADEIGAPLLGKVPLEAAVAAGGDAGECDQLAPSSLQPHPPIC